MSSFQSKVVKPYCKVCHDAGKSEKDYTSHFVRSAPGPNSKVVCPTLIAQECRYCFKTGHTVKFCPQLKSKEHVSKPVPKPSLAPKKEPVVAVNAYSDLYSSGSESDEDVREKVKKNAPKIAFKKTEKTEKVLNIEEFPSLCTPVMKTQVFTGYASVVLKAKEAREDIFEPEFVSQVQVTKITPPAPQFLRRLRGSWADEYSSDED
jgi:hypothetical protein